MPGPINPFQGKICSKNLFIQQNLPILALFNPCFAKVFCDFPASEGVGTSRAFPLRFFWQNSFRKGRRGKGVPRPPSAPLAEIHFAKKILSGKGGPLRHFVILFSRGKLQKDTQDQEGIFIF